MARSHRRRSDRRMATEQHPREQGLKHCSGHGLTIDVTGPLSNIHENKD